MPDKNPTEAAGTKAPGTKTADAKTPGVKPGAAVREILLESFGRVRELVAGVCDGLTGDEAAYRPDSDANSVAWLVWHLSRIQDDHICGLTGQQQVWVTQGWNDRFGLPFEPSAHGFGHQSADVAQVQVEPSLLDAYHAAVHEQTLAYVEKVTPKELNRVVDENWTPPVVASVRLVSILGDCLQHAGQAAYVRGLAQRATA